MSGFFGLFSPTDKSIDLEAFEQMRKATELEGFDGMETHVEDNIAMGHLMLRVSPESAYDKQPLKSSCGNYLLVGHFRLDYRDELGDKLGLIQSKLESTPDSVLVMMAYQKWKEKCVDHLEGDFAFVIHSKKENKISLFKDKMGISALFYYKFNDCFLFASSAASLQGIETINFDIDKMQLCRKSIYGLGLRDGYTLIKDLFFLKFGYYLIVNLNLDLLEVRYWHLEYLTPIVYSFEEDYAFEMHSKFSSAVKSRLINGKKTGLFLSSGLDSTAVASYLSNELELDKNLLNSYTSYPLYLEVVEQNKKHLIDETSLVKEFANLYPSISPQFLNFPDADILENLNKCFDGDSKYFDLSINTFWINGILEKAKEEKVKCVFTGQMGNYVISWDEEYKLLNMVLGGKFYTLLKELILIFKSQKKFIFSIIKSLILKDLFLRFRNQWQTLLFKSSEIYKPNFVVSKMITSTEWEKELSEINFIIKDTYFKKNNSKELRKIVFDSSSVSTGLIWYKLAHLHSIISIDPTRDERLVYFAFSIPESLYNQHGYRKYIYRLMMQDRLPDKILNASSKSCQSGDIALRVKSLNEFISKLNELLLSPSTSLIIDQKATGKLMNQFLTPHVSFLQKRTILSELFLKVSIESFVKNKKV